MKTRENRVRISDIAEELGLSTATVSNVIHGKMKKMSVAGFDDSLLARQIQPRLTTIGQDYAGRARLTMELLEKLHRREQLQLTYQLPLTLAVRESTGENHCKSVSY